MKNIQQHPPSAPISHQNSRRTLGSRKLLEVIPTETSLEERPYSSKPSHRDFTKSVSDWNPLDLSVLSNITLDSKAPQNSRLLSNYAINRTLRNKFHHKRASIDF